jgi:hypothetical protein
VTNFVTEDDEILCYPFKLVPIKKTQNRDELEHLFQVSQEDNGEDRVCKLRMDAECTSHIAGPGNEISRNGKISTNGGILNDDYLHFTSH